MDSHDEVGTQIEAAPTVESAQMETTVAISAKSNGSVGSLIGGPKVRVHFGYNQHFGMQKEATNWTFSGPAKSLPNLFQPFRIQW